MLPEVTSRQVKLIEKPKTMEHLVEVVAGLVDNKHATLSLPEVRFMQVSSYAPLNINIKISTKIKCSQLLPISYSWTMALRLSYHNICTVIQELVPL